MTVVTGELIAPIGPSGEWLDVLPIGIDAAHRNGTAHRGVWLHVLSGDGEVLVLRRAAQMRTCPGTLSIVGEHHSGREADGACARRALLEELPGLAAVPARLLRLRAAPRWFHLDYGDRLDRCLVAEYVLALSVNASAALAALAAAGVHAHEREASHQRFYPLVDFGRKLATRPAAFCAPELLPRALLDSLADMCAIGLSVSVAGCAALARSGVLAWARSAGTPAMAEQFAARPIVRTAAARRRIGRRRSGRYI